MRIGSAFVVAGCAALVARLRWDKTPADSPGGPKVRQIRDYRAVSPDNTLPEIAVAKNDTDPTTLTAKALAAIGGMARFVSRGDIVVVKPNIGWDRGPIHAANTNPHVVAAVVKAAYDAGAKRVVVTDVPCNEPNRCFQRSGIWKAAHELGADVVLPAEHRFRTMRLRGEILDEWPIFAPLVDADKIINVPVAKHHNLAKFTGAMKNWYGLLGGRRNRLHQSIDMSIADLAAFVRPTLTVVDATRVLVRNGPQGGNIDDTREMNTVIASVDQVAADAYACTLIGQKPENIAYLRMGQERGLGRLDWTTLRMKEA